jgi:glycosyltransferase involved in cell wall biosynthesis
MRIVAYSHLRRTFGRVTGVGKFIAHAPKAVYNCGHDVRLVAAQDEFSAVLPKQELPCAELPHRRRVIEWGGALIGWPRIDVDADWLWCPAESFVAVRGAKYAITAHTGDWAESDLPWSNEWRYRKLRVRWRAFYHAIRRDGATVLTVSEFLKRKLIDRIGIPGDRVHVVGHGVEPEYFSPTEYEIARIIPGVARYALVAGGLSKYKGGDRILAVAEQMPGILFVVVGDDAQSGSGYPNVFRCGYRNVKDGLPALYANATAVLILSRYETFGLPAAEAMAAGVPVVVANAGALPEVVGDAGCIVDGDDTAAVVGQLNDLIDDHQARSQLIERGRRRAENFRWERTGRRIVQALEART